MASLLRSKFRKSECMQYETITELYPIFQKNILCGQYRNDRRV